MRRGRSAVATGVRAVLKQGTRVVSPRPAAHGRCDGEVVRLHVFHSAAALPPACREGAVCREVQPSAGRVHGCHGVGGLEPALVVPAGEAASAGVSARRLKQPRQVPATRHDTPRCKLGRVGPVPGRVSRRHGPAGEGRQLRLVVVEADREAQLASGGLSQRKEGATHNHEGAGGKLSPALSHPQTP